jgi:hypothetical protein
MPSSHPLRAAVFLCLGLSLAAAQAQTAAAAPQAAEPVSANAPVRKVAAPERIAPSARPAHSATTPSAAPPSKPTAPSRQTPGSARGSDAEPSAAAPPEQLRAAERVMYGRYQCDEGQQVRVSALAQHPGFVGIEHGARRYFMRPLESSSGAIRLEGLNGETLVVQIASKSMLLNVKTGQRILDGCVRVEAEPTLQGAPLNHPAPTRP